MDKSQILANLSQELLKSYSKNPSILGSSSGSGLLKPTKVDNTNWPLIIGAGIIICCCCTFSSALAGYLIYQNNKEPFENTNTNDNNEVSDGSNELYSLILAVIIGLIILYLLTLTY